MKLGLQCILWVAILLIQSVAFVRYIVCTNDIVEDEVLYGDGLTACCFALVLVIFLFIYSCLVSIMFVYSSSCVLSLKLFTNSLLPEKCTSCPSWITANYFTSFYWFANDAFFSNTLTLDSLEIFGHSFDVFWGPLVLVVKFPFAVSLGFPVCIWKVCKTVFNLFLYSVSYKSYTS